jgi:hypothetical protein
MTGAQRLARVAVVLAVAAIVIFGVTRGLFVAAAADAYGYVSQADLWARGSPIVHQSFAREMTWPNAAQTLAPLGYRPRTADPRDTDIVPTYSPGLPMLMAVFKLAGGPRAVFLVVPLLGGLAVWATYLMGTRLAGSLVGASAAILLAASPTFLFEVVSPTSDVPCTAWWALALAWLMVERRSAAFGAGLATGLAILTRPNLAPLAVIPGAVLVWRAATERLRGSGGSLQATRMLLFAAGSIPACIVVALINRRLYGAPFASGYGPLDALYSWSYLWPNLARYPRWIVQTETVVVLLALVAPFALRAHASAPGREGWPRRLAIVWWCFIAANVLSYIFYLPFDEWWYVRFLMPAYPPLLVLSCAALWRLVSPLTRLAIGANDLAAATVVGAVAWHGVAFSTDRGAQLQWIAEQRYATVGRYIASTLPERAVLISMQHSGGIRYYSGRITVRYDVMRQTDLDLVVEELRRLGYSPYLVLDDWEEPQFRQRFEGQSALAGLDWMPVARLASDHVRIYDTADRQAGRPDRQRIPETIP